MLPASHRITQRWKARYKRCIAVCRRRRAIFHIASVLLLVAVLLLEIAPFRSSIASAKDHTNPSVDEACLHVGFSSDGNPFPVCPGPFPVGGNCVWWAWEQWHLLGYDLPLNWGNAADWITDAQLSGLSVGTTPRVGAIAVFPRADGVWAFGLPGHVAFVTAVSANGMSFDVTYQNYGDPTPIYFGKGYNVNVINQLQYQAGQLRFIYFPQQLDLQRFARLPGIQTVDSGAIAWTNTLLGRVSNGTPTSNSARPTATATPTPKGASLKIAHTSSEQEFNADFSGEGLSDLLLYNRQQGSLKVLQLQRASTGPVLVNLGDSLIAAGHWGSSLEVHIGDFSGSGKSEILLYDRAKGQIHLISLTPQLTIQRHTLFKGPGTGWEVYVGRFDGQHAGLFMYNPAARDTSTGPITVPEWEKQGRLQNIVLLNFNRDLSVHTQQHYTLWPANWEIYVGAFVGPHQDGVFLYDRTRGEGRLLDFDAALNMAHYQQMHHLNGNWQVYSGDFAASGRAQVLLYDPGNGHAQLFKLAGDLTVAAQKSYTDWGAKKALYVGHFGLPSLSVMLYDAQMARSTFLAFDTALQVAHQYSAQTWDQHWQILVGAFLDRSRCVKSGNCATGDDILLLNRQTGQLEQYIFSFGRTFKVYDNRMQSFVRQGMAAQQHLDAVDTTTFSLIDILNTSIRNEELY